MNEVSRRHRTPTSNGKAQRPCSGLTYHIEGEGYAAVSVDEVVASNHELDYALLRLADAVSPG